MSDEKVEVELNDLAAACCMLRDYVHADISEKLRRKLIALMPEPKTNEELITDLEEHGDMRHLQLDSFKQTAGNAWNEIKKRLREMDKNA